MARKKLPPTDGLGPREKKRIRTVIRQVWHQSHARRLCVERCLDNDGFPICESCFERVPKITVDHIRPVGEVDDGFIKRMFVPSSKLQGLCNMCHRTKTNRQRKKKSKAT